MAFGEKVSSHNSIAHFFGSQEGDLRAHLHPTALQRFEKALDFILRHRLEVASHVTEVKSLLTAHRADKYQIVETFISELETMIIFACVGFLVIKQDPKGQKRSDLRGQTQSGVPFEVEVVTPEAKEPVKDQQLISTYLAAIAKIAAPEHCVFFHVSEPTIDSALLEVAGPQLADFIESLISPPLNLDQPLRLGTFKFSEELEIKIGVILPQVAQGMVGLKDFPDLVPPGEKVLYENQHGQTPTGDKIWSLAIFPQPAVTNSYLNPIQNKVRNPNGQRGIARIVAANVTKLPNSYHEIPPLIDQHRSKGNWPFVSGFLLYTVHQIMDQPIQYSYKYFDNDEAIHPIPEVSLGFMLAMRRR